MKFSWHLPILFLLLLIPACRLGPKVPPELIGTWRTQDLRYENKFIIFDDEYVVLGLGEENTPKVGRIHEITTTHSGPITTYVIGSTGQADQSDRLTVQYSPIHGGELYLSNKSVWKKDAPDAQNTPQ